ncbi:hypothetical protein KJ693_06820 [bacterium]|nr:hypothetical protein [bacterium]MBU1615014.1 hypothetical protein [bacterium]
MGEQRKSEREILARFKGKGALINDKEEMAVLNKWALGGMIRFGVNLKEMKSEACLTKRGKWLLSVVPD